MDQTPDTEIISDEKIANLLEGILNRREQIAQKIKSQNGYTSFEHQELHPAYLSQPPSKVKMSRFKQWRQNNQFIFRLIVIAGTLCLFTILTPLLGGSPLLFISPVMGLMGI